ncbi:MAG: acyl-CoA thioesterase [Deltaproteobacteria bacterium]|nr:acyl-CoA thioesterase [Deltaproteobacteria bacterium]
MSEKLGRWPVQLDVAVQWGDMDAFGHVNNTVYLRWCESARIAYFETLGLTTKGQRSNQGPILARAAVDYRRPVVYPATVRVACTVSKLGNTSAVMLYRMALQPSGELVAEGESVIVLIDYVTGAKVPLDAELRQKIEALEAQGSG